MSAPHLRHIQVRKEQQELCAETVSAWLRRASRTDLTGLIAAIAVHAHATHDVATATVIYNHVLAQYGITKGTTP